MKPWLGLDRLLLGLTRRLLALWVRVTVVPADIETLELDPLRPVFYVLEFRHLSALLVLEQTCAEQGMPQPTAALRIQGRSLPRSVAALRRPAGWFRRRRQRYSRTLERLVAAALAEPGPDVQIVPVTVFWGRAPRREDSWLKLLSAERWVPIGPLRQFLRVLLHGRNTWVRFSRPLSLQALPATVPDDPTRTLRKLARILRVHFRQRRAALLGPELASCHLLVEQLLHRRSVRRAIQAEARERDIAQLKAAGRARRYAYEIAADFSYPFALFMRRLLRRLWDKLYAGIEIRHDRTLQVIAPGHDLIYLPCHRSHIDYLLLPYVLHAQGLAVPHVAAGINLNIPLIGPLLRRGGAFFLRRSFRGNALYGAVFQAYLATLLNRGVPIEYFIEGGRSRTGRSLPPKLGLLDMTVRGHFESPARPLALVPVYIGYEKLVEGGSYLAELQGRSKRSESLSGLIRGLRQLRGHFGQVHLNFGEPLVLDDYLDHRRPDWRTETRDLEHRPDWLPPLIDDLGRELLIRINAAADVNPINLLALVLLATPLQAMDEAELSHQLDGWRALLLTLPYADRTTVTALDGQRIIEHGLRLGMITRLDHPLGPIVRVAPGRLGLLDYFRNNVLHVFAPAALISACFRYRRRIARDELLALGRRIYPFLQAELFLRWPAEQADKALAQGIDGLRGCGQLVEQDGMLLRPADDGMSAPRPELLATAVQQSLERGYIIVSVLRRAAPYTLDQDQLAQRCRLLAERLALLHAYRGPDFSDRTLFRAFLDTLRGLGELEQDNQGRLALTDACIERYHAVWGLLDTALRQGIRTLAREETAATQPSGMPI